MGQITLYLIATCTQRRLRVYLTIRSATQPKYRWQIHSAPRDRNPVSREMGLFPELPTSHFPSKVFNPAFTTARHRHPASKQINHESVKEDNLICCITLKLNGPFAAATSTILFTDRRTRQKGSHFCP